MPRPGAPHLAAGSCHLGSEPPLRRVEVHVGRLMVRPCDDFEARPVGVVQMHPQAQAHRPAAGTQPGMPACWGPAHQVVRLAAVGAAAAVNKTGPGPAAPTVTVGVHHVVPVMGRGPIVVGVLTLMSRQVQVPRRKVGRTGRWILAGTAAAVVAAVRGPAADAGTRLADQSAVLASQAGGQPSSWGELPAAAAAEIRLQRPSQQLAAGPLLPAAAAAVLACVGRTPAAVPCPAAAVVVAAGMGPPLEGGMRGQVPVPGAHPASLGEPTRACHVRRGGGGRDQTSNTVIYNSAATIL